MDACAFSPERKRKVRCEEIIGEQNGYSAEGQQDLEIALFKHAFGKQSETCEKNHPESGGEYGFEIGVGVDGVAVCVH